ncbi:hypothetical protein BJ166DRAFT_103747 [Pestalotiopsis sp. NC0098]|nr:hypothetical protein BJ166DRAFT_103747 [Pestalotiopsis sp. NC0098]
MLFLLFQLHTHTVRVQIYTHPEVWCHGRKSTSKKNKNLFRPLGWLMRTRRAFPSTASFFVFASSEEICRVTVLNFSVPTCCFLSWYSFFFSFASRLSSRLWHIIWTETIFPFWGLRRLSFAKRRNTPVMDMMVTWIDYFPCHDRDSDVGSVITDLCPKRYMRCCSLL